MLTYGVLGGLGLGLIYLPAIVSVGFYFERRRALATGERKIFNQKLKMTKKNMFEGISVCGSGVGAFVMAPLVRWLVNTYDWEVSLYMRM